MTEWRTVNIPKEFKERIQEEKVENGDFSSVKEFLMYSGRKQLEEDKFGERVRKVLEEEGLI